MSRKNRAYGNSWLELRCGEYVVEAWTHSAAGPWWAPQSSMTIKKYRIASFKTLADYKAWRRKNRKHSFRNFMKSLESPRDPNEKDG